MVRAHGRVRVQMLHLLGAVLKAHRLLRSATGARSSRMAKRKAKTKTGALTREEALEQASERAGRAYHARVQRERKQNPEYGSLFEGAMRILFGDDAFHIAGHERTPKENRRWLTRAVKRCMKEVNALDTTDHHRERLLDFLGFALNYARKAKGPEPLVYCLLGVTSMLLGFEHSQGRAFVPLYARSAAEYRRERRRATGYPLAEEISDSKNLVQKRRDVVRRLKEEGHDTFEIALILKTSEHDVKKQLLASAGGDKKRVRRT